jgi:hypothetical protein
VSKFRSLIKSELFFPIFLLVAVSAIAYLPFIAHFSYYNDDWYEMYATGVRGPLIFIDIFSIDRPARALLMIPLYILFGRNPFPYNVTAYLFRLFSGLSVLWGLRIVWLRQKRLALWAALFYLIYPGFLSQPNAIDFQSHIAGLCFATFSIALSLKAVTIKKLRQRILLSVVSIFFGLAYLSQMEYYAGYEVVRFVLFFILAGQTEKLFWLRLKRTVIWYLPFMVAPLIFFTWRLFFFQDIRKQTDVGAQLGVLFTSPLHTILVWSATLIQNIVDIVLLAWLVPFYNAFSSLSPIDIYIGLGVALTAVLLAWISLRNIFSDSSTETKWQLENFIAGLVIVAGGSLPIIVANRSVDFADLSRYSVIGMFGAAMILSIFIARLPNFKFQLGFTLLLIGIAVITHYSNGESFARSAEANNLFWWQVSWRVPQMQTGTTIVVNEPAGHLSEDYTIWAPANLIYYPQSQSSDNIQPGLYAALLSADTIQKAMLHVGQEYDTRRGSIHTYRNYRRIIILSQPTPSSCVQVIDSNQLELSSSEDPRVMALAPYSQPKNNIVGSKFATPPYYPFGSEPPHDWCYYYEKASYARQTGDWQTVQSLGNEAANLHLKPQDLIEWMPFLQADAQFGNQAQLKDLAPAIASDPLVQAQACRILSGMQLDSSSRDLIKSLYCTSK